MRYEVVDYVHHSTFLVRRVWRFYPKSKDATTRDKITIWRGVGTVFYPLNSAEMKINANAISVGCSEKIFFNKFVTSSSSSLLSLNTTNAHKNFPDF